ncbi:GlxA family transcriptional regulator [Ancylobacter sp. G4_0304]|uniref:GlxA family transcriptional regulator n=1 Tax=Ancylobacter sp. G4_0304 TaxID=3114289 RepID=UPI0039C63861
MADSKEPTATGDDYIRWLDHIWSQRLLTAREPKPELSIGIVLWPTFPMMSLTGILEPLRHAADFGDNSRPVHCRWSIMGERGYSAVASCGVRIKADVPYINPTDFDYVVVIGGLLPHLRDGPPRHRDYLKAAAAAGVPLIAACTGIFVLAQEGLLADRRVAVHPFHREDFRVAFPALKISTRDDFVIDGDRITVPGGVSILSLMTQLIKTHCGPDRAAKTVHQLSLSEQPDASEFEKSRASSFRHSSDSRVQRAVVLIESRMGQEINPETVANHVGLSSRQFARLFQEHLGMTPKRFIIETRLRYAKWLVQNSNMPMTAIAYQTGFSDCAHFATSFKAKYGAPPSSLR